MELAAWWHDDPEWVGWLLKDARADLLRDHVFTTWVAGMEFYEAATGPTFAPGEPLVLRPDPENPVDPNAVIVFDAAGTPGGHVPRVIAKDLHARDGWDGLSLMELKHDGHRVQLWIVVSHEPVKLSGVIADVEPGWASYGLHQLQAHSERWQERRDQREEWRDSDPLAQMQQMAHDLDDRADS